MKGEYGSREIDFAEVEAEDPLVKRTQVCTSCWLRKNADLFEDNGDTCLDCRS